MRSACTASIAHSSNPPPPLGSAGSSGLATTDLALATVTPVKRRISDLTPIRLLAFYPDNGVVGFTSSETTEPVINKTDADRIDLLEAYYNITGVRCEILTSIPPIFRTLVGNFIIS